MAANGGQPPPSHYACKCLNIHIHSQPTQDIPPPAETGFKSVYVGEEGICVVCATLKSFFLYLLIFVTARHTLSLPSGVVVEPSL